MINPQFNLYRVLGTAIFSTSLAVMPTRPTLALNLDQIASLAYEITVKINDLNNGSNGSGVIIERNDDTYFVLSNQHVVAANSTYEIITVDGIVHPLVAKQEIPGLDLAVLQFKSEEFYEVASMGDSDDLTPLQDIYVAGFPGNAADLDLTSGAIRAIDRTILSNPKNKLGYALLYTNQTLPGSSGGPVIDANGRLVGINGEAERDMISGRDLSRGIPINLFKSFPFDFEARSNVETELEFEPELESELEFEPEFEPQPEPISQSDIINDVFAKAQTNYRSSYFLAYNPIGHDLAVTSVAVSPNGRIIASGSNDETINIWDAKTGKLLRTLEGHTRGVNSVKIARDGNTIVSGADDGTIRVWNGNTGELLRTLEGHEGRVNSVAIASDGRTIVSGSDDSTIMVWDWIDWELKAIIEEHTRGVNSVAIAPDNRTIVAGSDDLTITVWDLASLELKATLEGHERGVNSVAIASDGRTIVSGGSDGNIMIWDWTTWELKLLIEGHEAKVNQVKLSTDGSKIFSSSNDRSIRVWNRNTGDLVNIFQDLNTNKIYGFGTSDYEKVVVGGISDRSIRIWHGK